MEKGKRAAVKEQVEGTLELIQSFEFPEASNRVKTSRDGHHVVATGTYKPQIRVWDLDQLSLKFERHSDAENVDFILLSDDWTKSIHLQNDRSVEFHNQGGLYYRTRIPRFGRALAYHFPSCDALIAGAGNEVYRLNLAEGRFMTPLVLEGDGDAVPGVNCIDVNPAHQLFAFGVEGNGTVEFWDPRSRARVGLLRLPLGRLLPAGAAGAALPGLEDAAGGPAVSVTALASRADGLSYAVGTSTGHTLLYDIRSARPFAVKDQGYGLPVKNVAWIEGGSRMAGEGLVLSADRKVIKIWDKNAPSANFTSITPASDINDVHHLPGSGLLMLANEGIQMTTYYIPQLGPAPRWCSFLENLTEEMEDQTTRTAYQDFKFVERSELASLGLDHLIGTPALKPYMHGYFLSLQLYDTARLIANPYVYEEHRERAIREKMEKMAETRIRTRKDAAVKVNKALAEKIRKDDERERKKAEKKAARKATSAEDDAMDVDENAAGEPGKAAEKATLLNDPRFKDLFEDPEFQVDETSREFALLNPSSVAQRQNQGAARAGGRTRTAVESEEEESDKVSSDGLDDSASESGEGSGGERESEDSDAAGELWTDDIRARAAARESVAKQKKGPVRRTANVRLVPMRAQGDGAGRFDRNATFGQRRATAPAQGKGRTAGFEGARFAADGGVEMTYIPSASAAADDDAGRGGRAAGAPRRKGVETFGAGMEKGGAEPEAALSEAERRGRTQRRKGMRSGSKNTFRRL
ncbi:WD40 and NUC153 domain-containing protein [Phanerochaete sordida]|uniref:WD40 and NUC153 domain-containing protein n=1 Tax=Phanerochaete sordida TaxID=48140 RepID=A0A9P3GDM7_9APHY|nr:WD40 and NUC153 domain-containing protein [Phanerochaete sordida]